MNFAIRFAKDEMGATAIVDLILINSIVGLGMVVGLATFRDQANQFFGDSAVALENIDQSYSFTVGTVTSVYVDPGPNITDPAGDFPACMAIVAATPE